MKESPPKATERNEDKREPPRVKTSLVRSKSTGSLQSGPGSIQALRARFESRTDAKNTVRLTKTSIESADITHLNNGEAEGKEKQKGQTADAPGKDGKDDGSSQKVNHQLWVI